MGGNGTRSGPSVFVFTRRRDMLWEVRTRYTVAEVVHRAPFTYARVRFVDANGLIYEGCGFAKQNRYGRTADKWNTNTGRDIAVGRALHDLLDNLEGARKLRTLRKLADEGPAYAMTA